MASILYRASPIDPALKPGSVHPTSDLANYDSPSAEPSATRSPTSEDNPKQFSPVLPELSGDKFSSPEYKDGFPGSTSVSTSLPGLAALASVASAPTSNLRYVQFHGTGQNTLGSLSAGIDSFPSADDTPLLSGGDAKGARRCDIHHCIG